MSEKIYCGDCEWYRPGGLCNSPRKPNNRRYVCPIAFACELYEPKRDHVAEEIEPINPHICRKIRKTRKRHK